ncbi:MAG: hypothetical protein HZA35_04245 [Parcubacteria group bacterium]|nr:hypothetical protein [Parcubacteria group bacterium]
MAIILEQQKKPLGTKAIVLFVVILCVVGVGSYFLFFSAGKGNQMPSREDATGGITKIHADEFNAVGGSKGFTDLQQYPRLDQNVVKTHLGKVDPFQKF